MNYVMGEDGEYYEVMGEEFQTVGAAPAAGGRPAPMLRPGGLRLLNPTAQPRPAAVQLQAPSWRPALAPGVGMPGEGMEQLPLSPKDGRGVFSSTVNNIVYEARPQRPFRGERFMAIIGRVGPSAAGALPVVRPGFFVGTQIVGADLGDTPLDAFGPTSFGVRLVFPQATPGMLISVPVALVNNLAGTDTLSLSIILIGRSVRLSRVKPCAFASPFQIGLSTKIS